MQHEKVSTLLSVTPKGIERNCLGQLYIPNTADCTFEGRQQALKALSTILT